MIPFALLLAQTVPGPQLKLTPDGFLLESAGRTSRIPFSTPNDRPRASYRKDRTFVYWDQRGLTLGQGSNQRTTGLEDIALTPKLFPRDEIIANREAIERNEKRRAASAISGSVRVGEWVYFLPRWDATDGKPWLEALVRVRLGSTKPQWRLVGRFAGFTGSTDPIGDKLFATPNELFTITTTGKAWGIARCRINSEEFRWTALGVDLIEAQRSGSEEFTVLERIDEAWVRLVRIDLASNGRLELGTYKGSVALDVRSNPPLAVVPTHLGPALKNLQTGVQILMPTDAEYRRTSSGILIWPRPEPAKAVLYSTERALKLATVSPAAQ